jgi:hypothetical protein
MPPKKNMKHLPIPDQLLMLITEKYLKKTIRTRAEERWARQYFRTNYVYNTDTRRYEPFYPGLPEIPELQTIKPPNERNDTEDYDSDETVLPDDDEPWGAAGESKRRAPSRDGRSHSPSRKRLAAEAAAPAAEPEPEYVSVHDEPWGAAAPPADPYAWDFAAVDSVPAFRLSSAPQQDAFRTSSPMMPPLPFPADDDPRWHTFDNPRWHPLNDLTDNDTLERLRREEAMIDELDIDYHSEDEEVEEDGWLEVPGMPVLPRPSRDFLGPPSWASG